MIEKKTESFRRRGSLEKKCCQTVHIVRDIVSPEADVTSSFNEIKFGHVI